MTAIPFDGATCRTPAEHRDAIAIAGARRNDVLSWPTAERLRYDHWRLGLLARWRSLMEPPRVIGEPDPSDDGRALVIHRSDRPDEDELIKAWLRPTYVALRHKRGAWEYPVRLPGRVYLGELVFHNAEREKGGPRRGEMVEWGVDKHGKPLTPYENLSESARGGRRKEPPGTRQRKAIDAGGDWDGLHRSNTVCLDEERGDDAFDEVARHVEARLARKAVGPFHAEVLDLAISSTTAQEIGETFKYVGEYAEKKGVRLVNDAIDVFGEYSHECEAANDNISAEEEKIAA